MALAAVGARRRRFRIASRQRDLVTTRLRGTRPVTVETPAHRERRLLANAHHRFDGTVARTTRDVRAHVLTVVEGHEVRNIVDLRPRDRLPPLHRFLQLLDADG